MGISKERARSSDNADRTDGEILELSGGYTVGEEKADLRKKDMVIFPFMCFVFFLQYLDKQSLGYAGVFGLIKDLHMTSSQYSWSSSIFCVGQLASEYPFIYLMSRLPLTQFVGATVIVWGIMCMCLAAPTNFAGFAAVRFLLGFSEGAVSPAFVTITSIWYRKKEHNVRTALWITMNDLAQVIECFLMYGIGKNTLLSIAPWRVIFIICGAITFLAGVGFFILMPNGPKDAWFLNDHEREVLSLRMAEGREGGDKTSFSMAQLRDTHGPEGASCITASMTILLSLAASDFKGNTRRAIVNGMFFIGYCAGCIASPQLWTHSPRYASGVITSIVTWCLLFCVVILFRFLCAINRVRFFVIPTSKEPNQKFCFG